MLAFFAALPYELEGLKSILSQPHRLRGEGGLLFLGQYRGKEVLLAQTGMGRWGVEAVVPGVLDRYSPQAVIATGFAAAVNGGLRPGALLLCPGVFGAESAPSPGQSCDERLLKTAQEALNRAGVAFVLGHMLTASHLVRSPRPPGEVGLGVKAVDMESYWIGCLAAERGIPFLVARSISDSLSHPLPPLDHLMDRWGRWHKGKALGYFLSHPQAIARIALLARDSSQARKSLITFFKVFVESWR